MIEGCNKIRERVVENILRELRSMGPCSLGHLEHANVVQVPGVDNTNTEAITGEVVEMLEAIGMLRTDYEVEFEATYAELNYECQWFQFIPAEASQ